MQVALKLVVLQNYSTVVSFHTIIQPSKKLFVVL